MSEFIHPGGDVQEAWETIKNARLDAFRAGAEVMRELVIDYLGGNGSLEQIAHVRKLQPARKR